MSTSAERAATNRENAQYSTGPKTSEGKQRSSRNSLQHGLYSKALLLPHENAEEFNGLRQSLFAEHQPATPTEALLVNQMIDAAWRMRRFEFIEFCALTASHHPGQFDSSRLVIAERFHAAASRAFHRALAALLKVRKERAQDGFVPSIPQSEQKQARSSAAKIDPPSPPPLTGGFLFEQVFPETNGSSEMHHPESKLCPTK